MFKKEDGQLILIASTHPEDRKVILDNLIKKGKISIVKILTKGKFFYLKMKYDKFKSLECVFGEANEEDVEISKELNQEYLEYNA